MHTNDCEHERHADRPARPRHVAEQGIDLSAEPPPHLVGGRVELGLRLGLGFEG